MRRNYKAPFFWRREELADLANKVRAVAGRPLPGNFDVLDFMLTFLPRIRGRRIEVKVVQEIDFLGSKAYVDLSRGLLVVLDEVVEAAQLGDPEARFILAHEIGHIILHTGHEHFFSAQGEHEVRWAMEEEQTECQANWFAAAFLAPDASVRAIGDIDEIATACQLPRWAAFERFETVFRERKAPLGGICRRCKDLVLRASAGDGLCENCASADHKVPSL